MPEFNQLTLKALVPLAQGLLLAFLKFFYIIFLYSCYIQEYKLILQYA